MTVVVFRQFREYPVARAVADAFRCILLLTPLAGCAEADQTIARMDDFFFSLEGEPSPPRHPPVVVVEPPVTRHPGYAPPYPPYQASLGQ
jgi:hypothetical protein